MNQKTTSNGCHPTACTTKQLDIAGYAGLIDARKDRHLLAGGSSLQEEFTSGDARSSAGLAD